MVGKRRLIKPTLGIVLETGLAVAVPTGEIVDIPTATCEGNRTVDVLWEGKLVMMFVHDLEDRTQSFTP